MRETRLIKYQFVFPQLTKRLYENKRRIYDLAVISIRLEELQEKGARIVKINKPGAHGTAIMFDVVETEKEYQEAYDEIIRDGEALGLKFEKVAS